jgi:hypothetical protein
MLRAVVPLLHSAVAQTEGLRQSGRKQVTATPKSFSALRRVLMRMLLA